MNPRKKLFKYPSGLEGMCIDCDEYDVEIHKGDSVIIAYHHKKSNRSYPIATHFSVDWDDEMLGGKLTIKFKDRWGCEMIFTHYDPSDLKGMFDFIGRGYRVFDNMPKESFKDKVISFLRTLKINFNGTKIQARG